MNKHQDIIELLDNIRNTVQWAGDNMDYSYEDFEIDPQTLKQMREFLPNSAEALVTVIEKLKLETGS